MFCTWINSVFQAELILLCFSICVECLKKVIHWLISFFARRFCLVLVCWSNRNSTEFYKYVHLFVAPFWEIWYVFHFHFQWGDIWLEVCVISLLNLGLRSSNQCFPFRPIGILQCFPAVFVIVQRSGKIFNGLGVSVIVLF